jgi:hypothetical protein
MTRPLRQRLLLHRSWMSPTHPHLSTPADPDSRSSDDRARRPFSTYVASPGVDTADAANQGVDKLDVSDHLVTDDLRDAREIVYDQFRRADEHVRRSAQGDATPGCPQRTCTSTQTSEYLYLTVLLDILHPVYDENLFSIETEERTVRSG